MHKEPPPKSAGKRGKRICGGEEEFCLLLGLLLGHGDRQLLQLLIIHKVRAVGHGLAGGLDLGEGDDVPDGAGPGHEHAQPVQAVGQTAVGGAPNLKAPTRWPKRS